MWRRTRRQRSGCASRTGVGKTRHIGRWLWIQDAIRDKVVRLRKVKGNEKEAEMGTKDLDGPTHQRLLQELPFKPTQCRRFLGLISTEYGGSVVEVQVDGDEEEFWTFSAQSIIALLVAFVTCVMWNALPAVPVRTVERGTQSELNPVDSIVFPMSVFCSPVGECCDMSRKCEGLQNVLMNAIKWRRSCMYCEQRDGRRNGKQREG